MDEMTPGGPYPAEDFHVKKLSCQHINRKYPISFSPGQFPLYSFSRFKTLSCDRFAA